MEGVYQGRVPQAASFPCVTAVCMLKLILTPKLRSMLALHHMDALWYQILSVPRSISHLEIKHDMPCHDSLWTTASASEWAHRTLTASCSSPPIRYTDAIRCFLSPLPDPEHAPQLELLGALNVIHFLQSSLREVSGWSAMTGRVSLDRFDVSCKLRRM